MIYGTAWKRSQTRDCVERALAAGFRAIDTANQLKHYDEALVGEAWRGSIPRAQLFLQSKFTSLGGQDHRLPYEAGADPGDQVQQSFISTLQHLGTEYLDSYLVHGPIGHPGLEPEDLEIWAALEALYGRGHAKRIGVSNVLPEQLELYLEHAKVKPMVVQNRCYARLGWDAATRTICREHGIEYQGFSLLTANPEVLSDRGVHAIAHRLGATPAQVVFRFCAAIGITALTGTTDSEHMRQDLAAAELTLNGAELEFIETLAL